MKEQKIYQAGCMMVSWRGVEMICVRRKWSATRSWRSGLGGEVGQVGDLADFWRFGDLAKA